MLEIVQEALTFDDVLLLPDYSTVLPKDVCLKTRLTRGISLSMPLVSAAMDTVTEARMAIAMAQEGGIGILHKNMDIGAQAAEVRRVKKFEAGVVQDPVTVSPKTRWASSLKSPRPTAFPGCQSCRAIRWWASSPAAICALRHAWICRSPPS